MGEPFGSSPNGITNLEEALICRAETELILLRNKDIKSCDASQVDAIWLNGDTSISKTSIEFL